MSNFSAAESRAWTKVADELAGDPTRSIPCSSCGKAILKVWNLPSDDNCLERRVFCEACGKDVHILKPSGHAVAQRAEPAEGRLGDNRSVQFDSD
jgi:hypothetical protein